MRIRAKLREMAANEIADMIGSAKIREIKTRDPRPVFKAFVVGHEGEARGNMVGVGNIVKRWFQTAVMKLHEKINAGLQLFNGHGQTNDQTGREPIGEVVGKKAMNIGGRLSAVVACYIYPNFRHLPLNVASIEADVQLEQDARHGLWVADVDQVTGIALANSDVETPGFAGATLLGQLQAFAKSKNVGDEFMEITIEDVRSFLKAEKPQPSDLFGVEELTSDPAVRGFVENEKRNAVAGEYAHRKRTEEGFDKTRKELEDSVKAKEAELNSLRLEAAKGKVGQLFEAQKATRKLSEKQSAFIQARLSRFAPKKVEEIEKEFGAFLDSEIDEFGNVSKLLGVGEKPIEGNKAKTGAEPDENKPSTGENPYIDPAKNPMIKLD